MTASDSTHGVPEPSAGDTMIQAGARFGDLTLLRQLGRGNQGVVWEAHQKSLERRVAVKILPGEITSNEEQIQRFHREAEAAGRLSHPSIVAVYGFAELGGHRLILQELVTGGSLEGQIEQRHKDKPRTGPDDCRWAAEICRQLAEALHHAHQHNVIHRDIKPGNVLMSPEGVPKIADFGLAKVADMFELSQTGALMGTPHYMSPEQVAARQSAIDARTDVYSLGAMLYRMLTQQVPFSGDSLQKIFMDILSREPRPPRKLQPDIDADLEAVCLKALEKSPDRRYASAHAFADDLQHWLDREPTVARPVGAIGRLARSLGHMATSTLAVIAVLVPTAWFATDVLLEKQTREHVERHDWRLAAAGLATLLLCWPLGYIAVRLARGRRWAVAPACGLVLVLGAATGWMIRDQKTTQLHHADRQFLAQELRVDSGGTLKSATDIEEYVARWSPRFDGDDYMLVARAFLKRDRPVQAGEWAGRLLTAGDTDPVHQALLCAVETALGHDDRAREAEQRLDAAAAATTDWTVWEQVGSILLDMRRFAKAGDAFQHAGSLPGANRDLLNLELAQASAGQCAWSQASDSLHDFIKWQPNDPAALLLAMQISLSTDDWPAAEDALARLEANAALRPNIRLQQRRDLLLLRDGIEAAGEHLKRSLPADGSASPLALAWCGNVALEQSRLDADHAQDWLLFARDGFTRLIAGGEELVLANAGLAYADIKLALRDPGHAAASLDDAIAASNRAIELDPGFYEGHHNLGTARLHKALMAHGGKDTELTVEELAAITDALRSSLEYNGLQPLTLNDTAYALSLSFRRDGDEQHLRDAMALVQRAILLLQPAPETACGEDAQDRFELSSCYDTLSGLQELLHDMRAALSSAKLALFVLEPGDRGHDKRRDNVARLESLLANQ